MTNIRNLTGTVQSYFQDLERSIIKMMCERLGKINGAESNDLENLMKLQNVNEDLRLIEKEIAEIIDKSRAEIYNKLRSTRGNIIKRQKKNMRDSLRYLRKTGKYCGS